MGKIDDYFKKNPPKEVTESSSGKIDKYFKDIYKNSNYQFNVAPVMLSDLSPNEKYNFSEVNTEIPEANSDWINSLLNAYDNTQKSAQISDREFLKTDEVLNRREQQRLLQLIEKDPLNKNKYEEKLSELQNENISINEKINSVQKDIDINEQEIEDNPVSKRYKLEQSLINAKGANASFPELMEYSFPSGLGSQVSMLAKTIPATFGKKALQRIALAGITGLVEGGVAGAGILSEFTAPIVSTIAMASQIGLLYSARKDETKSELGENIEKVKNELLSKWQSENPDVEPPQEILDNIQLEAMKGTDQLKSANMSLLIPDAIETLLTSSLFKGSSIIKGFGNFGNYNKYTRLGKKAAIIGTDILKEKSEEGFQFIQGERYENTVFNKTIKNENILHNILTDYYDTGASINYNIPGMGNNANFGGKYANNSEFQASAEAGGLLSLVTGGLMGTASIYNDLSTYYKTANELKNKGVANIDDKFFKLKDSIYLKHFQKSNVDFLLEGVRNLVTTKDENGNFLMSEEQAKEEIKNIKSAYEKYQDVEEHLETVAPQGFLKSFYNQEQKDAIKFFKVDLFNQSMQLTRENKDFSELNIEKQKKFLSKSSNFILSDLDNQIQLQTKLINSLTSYNKTGYSDENSIFGGLNVFKKIYNTEDRLKFAEKKLKDLQEQKKLLLQDYKNKGINTEIQPLSIEESNLNKHLLYKELNITEAQEKYNNLLKVNSDKSLQEWYNEFKNNKKEKDSEINAYNKKVETLKNNEPPITSNNKPSTSTTQPVTTINEVKPFVGEDSDINDEDYDLAMAAQENPSQTDNLTASILTPNLQQPQVTNVTSAPIENNTTKELITEGRTYQGKPVIYNPSYRGKGVFILKEGNKNIIIEADKLDPINNVSNQSNQVKPDNTTTNNNQSEIKNNEQVSGSALKDGKNKPISTLEKDQEAINEFNNSNSIKEIQNKAENKQSIAISDTKTTLAANTNIIMFKQFLHDIKTLVETGVFKWKRDKTGNVIESTNKQVNYDNINNPDVIKQGDVITFEIVELDTENKRESDELINSIDENKKNLKEGYHEVIAIKHSESNSIIGFIQLPKNLDTRLHSDALKTAKENRESLIKTRLKILESIKKGEKLNTKILTKGSGNIITLFNEETKLPIFKKINGENISVFNDTEISPREKDKIDGKTIIVYNNGSQLISPNIDNSELNEQLIKLDNWGNKGQVFMMVRSSNNNWYPVPVYPNKLTENQINKIVDIIIKNQNLDSRDIVNLLDKYIYATTSDDTKKLRNAIGVRKKDGKLTISIKGVTYLPSGFNSVAFKEALKSFNQNITITNLNTSNKEKEFKENKTLTTNAIRTNGEWTVQPYLEFEPLLTPEDNKNIILNSNNNSVTQRLENPTLSVEKQINDGKITQKDKDNFFKITEINDETALSRKNNISLSDNIILASKEFKQFNIENITSSLEDNLEYFKKCRLGI